MSESDWPRSHCVSSLLDTLAARGDPPERKLRLFALACARRVTAVQTCPGFPEVLDACERHADDVADLRPLAEAEREFARWHSRRWRGGLARLVALLTDPLADPGRVAHLCQWLEGDGSGGWSPFQADLLRDIFGNPFTPPEFRPEWRSSTAAALAASIHRSGDYAGLPILADALEDAGCDAAPVLDHLRAPGYHVRGCWAVDLVLNPPDDRRI